MTQDQLASKIRGMGRPMSRLMLTQTENGKRAVQFAEVIFYAQAFGMSPADLVAGVSNPTSLTEQRWEAERSLLEAREQESKARDRVAAEAWRLAAIDAELSKAHRS